MPVTFQAINKFAQARPPGIYKQDYIDTLYMFFNEKKPESLVCQQTPEWKSLPDPDVHDVSFSATDNRADILQQVHAHSCLHNLVILEDMVAVCMHMILSF